MEQHAVDQLQSIAKINRAYPRAELSRTEKLLRWAQVLERHPDVPLLTLRETEYRPDEERAVMRADGTAISIAFADPVLRAAGLEGDTYGDARRFFELSDRQLHRLVCFCHFGARVNAGTVAYSVRSLADNGAVRFMSRVVAFFRR